MGASCEEGKKKRWLARDALNMILWAGKYDADDCLLYYIHRGVKGDRLSLRINEIVELGQMFFLTADSTIPYHRILAIVCGDRIIWKKKGADLSFIDR